MPALFPQFIKIKDFNRYESDSNDTEVEELSSKYKNHNLCETQDSQNSQTQSFKPRIIQNNHSQLSFQKFFMNEHIQAFDFQVKIYLESIFENDPFTPHSSLNQALYGKKSQSETKSCTMEFYLKSNRCLLSSQESQILMEKLQCHQKLKEFLQQICLKSSDQIALEFLFLARYVLEEYQKIQNEDLSYDQLVCLLKKLVEQNLQEIKIKNNLQFLLLKRSNQKPTISTSEKNQAQKKLIQFLIITMFLVASEYVNNPYYSQAIENQLKRHIFFTNTLQSCDFDDFSQSDEDSECQLFSHSKKKRK